MTECNVEDNRKLCTSYGMRHQTTMVFPVILVQPYRAIFIFAARRNARIASTVLATAIPSVCLSHAGIVSKRLHGAVCTVR